MCARVCMLVCLGFTDWPPERKELSVSCNTEVTGEEKRNDVSFSCIVAVFLFSSQMWTEPSHYKLHKNHWSGFLLQGKNAAVPLILWWIENPAPQKEKTFFFISLSAPKTCLVFVSGSKERLQEGTGGLWRGQHKSLDSLLSSCQKPNEDISEQILRGSPRALPPLDPNDTFLIGPSENS